MPRLAPSQKVLSLPSMPEQHPTPGARPRVLVGGGHDKVLIFNNVNLCAAWGGAIRPPVAARNCLAPPAATGPGAR